MKILIVDDARLDRELIRRMAGLAVPRAELLSANGPDDAILHILEGGVDCVLMDYQMPECNGLDLIRKLQRLRPENLPPIIMLTITR